MTTSEFKAQFFALIEKGERVVITSHISPDDDSIGSVLLMLNVLTTRYPAKDIRIIYTGNRVNRYSIFHNFDDIQWVDDVANHLEGVDILVTLDASNWRRFSKQQEILAAVPTRIGVDHHASEPDEYTLLFKDETACANTELLHRIFFEDSNITKEVAEYLLLGIIGDTGGLSYVQPTNTAIFNLTGSLVEKVGVPLDLFRSRYMSIPVSTIPLLQELVQNMQYKNIGDWPPVQYTYISSRSSYTDEDMSAASHIFMSQYLTRVEGYSWGFVVTPRADGTCRMSGRSLPGSVDVRTFHEALGIGSGHIRAAGGYFPGSDPEGCISTVLQFMQNNKPVLG